MKIRFTPTAALPVYRLATAGGTLEFLRPGDYEVDDLVGATILEKRPDNFVQVLDGVKDAPAPDHDRMAKKPWRKK